MGVRWIGPVNDVAMQAGAIIDVVMWYVCRALGVRLVKCGLRAGHYRLADEGLV